MEPDSRRVYVFIVLGLIAAVVVGLGVWRMSTPSARYSNAANNLPTSTATSEHTSTEKSTTSTSHRKPSREKPSPTKVFSDARDADHKHPESTDPYLAPNAVTHRSATNRPTKVYRPGNVAAPDASANNAPSNQGEQSPQNGNGASTLQPVPDQPTPSSPAPFPAPSEELPGQTDGGGESAQPQEPSESGNPAPPSTQSPQKPPTEPSAQRTPEPPHATTEVRGAKTVTPYSTPQVKNKSHAEPEATE
ncbi:hypothetical protein [Corynebacterium macginleyi]|uniref:hypothetical protein n=1 Tax=Corynebacterium macginleyi TaxID=38290 RepID=UPI00190AB6AD|nr:hypothetical protein [Corynebacterium macginleyi]MBM0261322.1 hypothetical protein [Corynebacterium macginleyi]QRJ57396.1 hypothetical protein GWO64_009050 [Corynebacterium macginleyi]